MENWHTATIKRFKTLSTESLYYIRKDASEAAAAGMGYNPKVDRYLDEVNYASAELHRRGEKHMGPLK